MPGHDLDQRTGELLLDTLTPLTVEAAFTVTAELEHRAAEADALRAAHVAQDTYNHARQTQLGQLTDTQKARIHQLITDLPGIWNDPTTPARERKRIARLLLTDITVTRDPDQITAHVRLRGGQHHTLALPLPNTAWELRQTPPATVTEINQLLDHHTHGEIAEILNQRGLTSGDGRPFHALIVRNIRDQYQLPSREQRLRDTGLIPLTEMATRLGVSPSTIKTWHRTGLVSGQRYNDKNECSTTHPTSTTPSTAPRPAPPKTLTSAKINN